MKQFLIRYRRGGTDAETWHRDVAAFIAALDGDAELSGKISRIAACASPTATIICISPRRQTRPPSRRCNPRDYFKRYNERTRQVAADGKVEVLKLDVVAETKNRGRRSAPAAISEA